MVMFVLVYHKDKTCISEEFPLKWRAELRGRNVMWIESHISNMRIVDTETDKQYSLYLEFPEVDQNNLRKE